MIREILWRIVARIVTIPAVTEWLIARAKRTPYSHIPSRDGSATYMERWWLFNPYGKDADGNVTDSRWPWLPSIRIHHILLADDDEHLHDHPWDARTILLRGWYDEERPYTTPVYRVRPGAQRDELRNLYRRESGHTGRLLFGEYHRIRELSEGGVFTLFFTWKYRGMWGFKVDGAKVPYRQYLDARRQS